MAENDVFAAGVGSESELRVAAAPELSLSLISTQLNQISSIRSAQPPNGSRTKYHRDIFCRSPHFQAGNNSGLTYFLLSEEDALRARRV